MLPDLKYIGLPFSPSFRPRVRSLLLELFNDNEKSWAYGHYPPMGFLIVLLDRLANRSQGLLAVFAISFSVFLTQIDGPFSIFGSIILCFMILSLLCLLRSMMVTWAGVDLLRDNEAAFDHYLLVLMARIRSFYVGTLAGLIAFLLILIGSAFERF